jgi:hypothetical protein
MSMQELFERIKLLEYHQKLLLKITQDPKLEFFKLIIEKGITEQEVQRFFRNCEDLCIKWEEQKAEGFVHFYPLFDQFTASLPRTLHPEEVIPACMRQKLYEPIMIEFNKYIKS